MLTSGTQVTMGSSAQYPSHATTAPEIDITFGSIGEWQEWYNANGYIFAPDWTKGIVDRLIKDGFVEPLTRTSVHGAEIKDTVGNLREGLTFRGVNSRGRAVLRA